MFGSPGEGHSPSHERLLEVEDDILRSGTWPPNPPCCCCCCCCPIGELLRSSFRKLPCCCCCCCCPIGELLRSS